VKQSIVPYITSRQGETLVPNRALTASYGPDGKRRIAYGAELRTDRDPNDVLWARCSQRLGADGLPTGEPRWRDVHPTRQRECMQSLLCQVCAQPARTPEGFFFMLGSHELGTDRTRILTPQPPVCRKHVRTAGTLCPYLKSAPTVLLTRTPRIHGVVGCLYEPTPYGVRSSPNDLSSLPYGHPYLRWYLASQMVRRLESYEVVEWQNLPG